MPTAIKMPALSPTMEEGTLARWLVKEGDTVSAGDIMAEIETDKATMEFEAVDEGTIARIDVAEGTEGVKVGTVIAMLASEGEDASTASAPTVQDESKGTAITGTPEPIEVGEQPEPARATTGTPVAAPAGAKGASVETAPVPRPVQSMPSAGAAGEGRVIASPLAKRIAAQNSVD